MKKVLIFILTFLWGFSASAQIFWTFDDNQEPILVPEECEGHFDEVRGGVFNPTIDELYEYGLTFLSSSELPVKQQGAYCILSAALQGHAKSQFLLAQMYEQGKILPQDDLSAYKWSFMAALNGEKDAERYTLTLEQFLTTDELERTNSAIDETRRKVQENIQKQMEEEKQKIAEERAELTKLAEEIQQFGGKFSVPQPSDKPSTAEIRSTMPDLLNVFDEKDHAK